MLTIDGSAGEGGGQVLRTSLALSAVTGKAFNIERIRGKRSKPGLLRQHLTAVKAIAEICGARVSGAELGSASLLFDTVIEIDTRLRESAIAGLPIIYHSPKSRSSLQYRALAQEILTYVKETTPQTA